MVEQSEPRQPRDLDGLLKLCMEIKGNEDSTLPGTEHSELDSERIKWLQEAIKSMTVDVVQQLLKGIKILNQPCMHDISANEQDIKEGEAVFEAISDWIGNIDMANNFHKIGGFPVLKQCIKLSPHSTIRSGAANTIAELSQCNPYCQERFAQEGFIQELIKMLATGSKEGQLCDEKCSVKSLYALSCIVRNNPNGMYTFLSLNGPECILNYAIQPYSASRRLRTKACFFISSICAESKAAAKAFSDMGIARQLLILLQQEEHQQADEHVVKALLTLLKDDPKAQQECKESSELNFRSLINLRIKELIGKEQNIEELEYYHEINDLCYGPTTTLVGEEADR